MLEYVVQEGKSHIKQSTWSNCCNIGPQFRSFLLPNVTDCASEGGRPKWALRWKLCKVSVSSIMTLGLEQGVLVWFTVVTGEQNTNQVALCSIWEQKKILLVSCVSHYVDPSSQSLNWLTAFGGYVTMNNYSCPHPKWQVQEYDAIYGNKLEVQLWNVIVVVRHSITQFHNAHKLLVIGTSMYNYVKACRLGPFLIPHIGHAYWLSNLQCGRVETAHICSISDPLICGDPSVGYIIATIVIEVRALWCCS